MRDAKTITTGEPMKCIWMTAGAVAFKLCNLEYDCDHCSFDRAIRGQADAAESTSPHADAGSCDEHGFRMDAASFYAGSHLWLRVEEEGRVRLGLDDFGQRLTGRIYSVRLPDPGEAVAAGKGCWSITHGYGETVLESVVAGSVVQRNDMLLQRPSLMNSDPYGEGWALLLEPQHLVDDLKKLCYGKRVREWYADETQLLRRSLEGPTASIATLPDGGSPADLYAGINAEIIEMFLSSGREVRKSTRR